MTSLRMAGPLLTVTVLLSTSMARPPALDRELYPGEQWMQYENIEEAGFSRGKLAEAHAFYETLDSAGFMVVSGGAVVAAWGDTERRFMCHSVRKSFLSALFGVFEGDIAIAHFNLAKVLVNAGRTAEAKASAQRALEIDPTHERAKAMLEKIEG